MKILLSLDMSTTCTGWSSFDCDTGKLLDRGTIKPGTKVNGISIAKLDYPAQQLHKMIDISIKLRTLIENQKPTFIVIEEIAGSRSRLTQKTLDGLHYIVAFHIQEYLPIVRYFDVGGADGWRTWLKLRLSEADKLANKEAKKLNKNLARGTQLLPIIDWKDLACRYVNSIHGLDLNPQKIVSDGDIGDSIAIGTAWLKFKYPLENV